VNDFDLAVLTDFRAEWSIGPLTAMKKLERLRSILKFAAQRKMLQENPVLLLSNPNKSNPTLPFSKDEIAKMLKAAESDEVDLCVKASFS
jgi:site-specific recombinase XerD